MSDEEDDFEWSSALMKADESGDLRPLLEFVLTKLVRAGVAVPEWTSEEFADLFSVWRLSGRRCRSPEEEQVRRAAGTYFSLWSRKPGEKKADRIGRVIAADKLSEKQANALYWYLEGQGRPSEHVRRDAKDAGAIEAYAQSLRELLRRHRPPCPTGQR